MAMTAEFDPISKALIVRATGDDVDLLEDFNAAGHHFGIVAVAGGFGPNSGNVVLEVDTSEKARNTFIKEWRRPR